MAKTKTPTVSPEKTEHQEQNPSMRDTGAGAVDNGGSKQTDPHGREIKPEVEGVDENVDPDGNGVPESSERLRKVADRNGVEQAEEADNE